MIHFKTSERWSGDLRQENLDLRHEANLFEDDFSLVYGNERKMLQISWKGF